MAEDTMIKFVFGFGTRGKTVKVEATDEAEARDEAERRLGAGAHFWLVAVEEKVPDEVSGQQLVAAE